MVKLLISLTLEVKKLEVSRQEIDILRATLLLHFTAVFIGKINENKNKISLAF